MGRLTGSFTFAAEYSLTCVGSAAAGRCTAQDAARVRVQDFTECILLKKGTSGLLVLGGHS